MWCWRFRYSMLPSKQHVAWKPRLYRFQRYISHHCTLTELALEEEQKETHKSHSHHQKINTYLWYCWWKVVFEWTKMLGLIQCLCGTLKWFLTISGCLRSERVAIILEPYYKYKWAHVLLCYVNHSQTWCASTVLFKCKEITNWIHYFLWMKGHNIMNKIKWEWCRYKAVKTLQTLFNTEKW